MDEKMIDEILNNLIKEAGPTAIDEMTREDLANLEKSEFEFSKEHEEKMEQFLDAVEKESLKKEKTAKKDVMNQKKSGHPFKKVLILAAATIAILAIAISSVGAWRESFVKYVLNIQEDYSDVKTNNKNTIREGKDCWVDDVYFGYIPSDYDFKTKKVLAKKTIITLDNNKKSFIILEMIDTQSIPKIDTESGKIEEIVVNEKDMVYSENEENKFLTWQENNKVNVLNTTDSKEVLLEIAKNIKFSTDKSQEN